MSNWLNQDLRFGSEVIQTVPWSNHLVTQGTALFNEINSAGGSNYILIGHSQGGLIARSAAQQFQAANPNQTIAEGVVTLDTPNQGADIAITVSPVILGGLALLFFWPSRVT